MATSVGLFEAKSYFSFPFGVIFSANLTGQIVFYFSARIWFVTLIDIKELKTEEEETVEYNNGN